MPAGSEPRTDVEHDKKMFDFQGGGYDPSLMSRCYRVSYLLQENHGTEKVVASTTGSHGTSLGIHALNHMDEVDMRVFLAGSAIAKRPLDHIFVLQHSITC